MFGTMIKYDSNGNSDLMVLKAPQGWFIGYYHQEDDGNSTQFRMSGYFPCPIQAKNVLDEINRVSIAA
jgi:hypothetical protein